MSWEVVVRPEAEDEIAEAFAWYEGRVAGLGHSFLLCLDASFSAIMRNPVQFPKVYSVARRALLRRFPYQVFFVEDEGRGRIVVLAVFHARRDPKVWRRRVRP